ncbi:unnamed protein product [Rhizoctonia solani]|uniref:Uncharacterized protein n=1 Tax=Rhizoctonia solani TaxID=456999 RepID=A0A8H2WEM8_9AGAM|nr:unnamed protein product [Rhizoctonia solani]
MGLFDPSTMSSPQASASLVEIRHLESGKQIKDDLLTISGLRIVDQAGTSNPNQSSDVWRTPAINRPCIDFSASAFFAYSRLPPNKQLLLQTIPFALPSNISPLLDWDSEPTELEDLGLLGLEDFRSCIKPSSRALPVSQPPLLKRRSLEGRPQDLVSGLTKRSRFAIPLPAPSNLPGSSISAKIQSPALSALQSKSATKSNGPVRLRLGLTKRTNIGSRLAPNRPTNVLYDVSPKAKLTLRNPMKPNSPPKTEAESSDVSSSTGGTLAYGFKILDSAFSAEKLCIQLPIGMASANPSRSSNLSETMSRRTVVPAGRVLVPSSPSPLVDRTTEVPALPQSYDPGSPGSYADTSMLSAGVPGSPLLESRNAKPPSALPGLSNRLLPINIDQVQLPHLSSNILPSGSLSFSPEEPDPPNLSNQKDPGMSTSSHIDTSYDLKPDQLMASVFYDSSQGSNASQSNQVDISPNSPINVFAVNHNHESLPWELSPLENQDGSQLYGDHDPRPPELSRVVNSTKVSGNPGRGDSDINGHELSEECVVSSPRTLISITGQTGSSGPTNHHSNSGIKSILYDSSQDSPQLRPREVNSNYQHNQGQEEHPTAVDTSIPIPSWSSDISMQPHLNYALSGAWPTSSWEPFSIYDGGSPDELVSASYSLSLEDSEVRCLSDGQLRQESSAQSVSLTPLGHSTPHYSNTPTESTNGRIYNMSPPHGFLASANKRPGMSKLASYANTEGSLVKSNSPILSFTPLPKRNIPDDSLESIESPDISQRITTSKPFRNNPIFKFPSAKFTPELEEDISCESQVLRPKISTVSHGIPVTSHSTPTPNKVTRDEENQPENDRTPEVPSSISASAHDEQQIPPNVDETEDTDTRKIPQSREPSPAPDHPHLPTPQPQPPSPLTNKIYKSHLHNVIPQPHFLPSLPCPPLSLTEGMLASLVPPSFQNWFNQNGEPAQDQAAAAENFLSDTWGRAAWIIPVRGRAPWEGCSGAIVSLRPIKDRKKRIIVWTPAALRSFWTQIAGFRDTKRVGSLSMSFEAAPGKPSELEAPKKASELKATRSFEFIKLYHDSRVSLKLRTILQVLEFADEDRYGVDADVPREEETWAMTTRRLLGASTRLALLDGTGHIVLIS